VVIRRVLIASAVVAVLALAVVGGQLTRPAPVTASGPAASAPVGTHRAGEAVPPRPVCAPGLRCAPTLPSLASGPTPIQWLAVLGGLTGLIALAVGRVARRRAGPPAVRAGPPLYRPPRAVPLLAFA
jgi:hypothetical protein